MLTNQYKGAGMLARAGRAHSRRTANRQPGPINGVNQRKQTQALATSGEQRVLPGRSPTAKPSSFSRRIPAGVRRRQRGLATARGTARIEASVSSANNGFGLCRTTGLFVCWPDSYEKSTPHIKKRRLKCQRRSKETRLESHGRVAPTF